MDQLDPRVAEVLERLGLKAEAAAISSGKMADATNAQVKSLTRQALEQASAHRKLIDQIAEQIKAGSNATKQEKELARATADRIKQEEEQFDANKARDDAQKALDDDRTQRMKKLIGDVKALGGSALSATSSFYSSKEVFTATIPTLELVGNAFKAVIEATGLLASGITVLGFSAGKATEGLSKIAIAAVDLTVQVAKMQLELSQKYLNTYNDLAKTGVTFGGNLTALSKAAHEGGIDLQTYGEFVKKNIEGLSGMSGTVEQAAARVLNMSHAAIQGNDKLLLMYGGFEGVNDALAGYNKLIAQTGFDTVKNQGLITTGSKAYLTTLKELQELTGMSVDAIQKEQEEAQKDVAFRQKLRELEESGPAGFAKAQALRELQIITLRTQGKETSDLFKEKVALDGQVISQSGNTFRAFYRAQDQYTDNIIKTAGMEKNARYQAVGEYITQSRKQSREEMKAKSTLFKIGTYNGDEVTKVMTDAARNIFDTEDKSNNIPATIAKMLDDSSKPIDEAGKNAVKLEETNMKGRIRVDKLVEERMGKMAKIAEQLTDLQIKLIELFGDKLTDSVDLAVDALVRLANASLRAGGDKEKSTGNVNQKVKASQQATLASTALSYAKTKMTADEAKALLESGDQKYINQSGGKAFLESVAAGSRDTGLLPKPDYSGIKLKSDEAVAGGPADEQMIAAVRAITEKYSGTVVNAMDDAWHRDPKNKSLGSAHTRGKAADLSIPGMDEKMAAEIQSMLKGISAQYEHKGEGMANGDHIHLEMKKLGGISNKPAIGGEAGPEAFVPLPDGRTIPVSMDNTQLVTKLQELIDLTRDHVYTSEKIHKAVA